MLSIKRPDTVGEFFRSRVHVRFEPSSGAAESRPALRGNGDHPSPPSQDLRRINCCSFEARNEGSWLPWQQEAVWTDLTMMRPRAKATKDPKFLLVFSQRSATRLKRLSLPTSCSMRARAR